MSVSPSLTDPTVTPAAPSTSALQSIQTASLIIDKKTLSPKSIDKVKSLISKESRVQTLITVGTEEAATHFDAITSQDKKSYDGDVSEVDKEDAEVIPDEAEDSPIKTSKPAGDDKLPDNEGQDETNKEDGDQTAKSGDKKPVQKCGNWVSSRSQDGTVSYDKDVLTTGRTKYPRDHISAHCVQGAGRVLLMNSFGMLKEGQKMSNIFFHMDIPLVNGLTLQGGEWPSVPWYPDTPIAGAAT